GGRGAPWEGKRQACAIVPGQNREGCDSARTARTRGICGCCGSVRDRYPGDFAGEAAPHSAKYGWASTCDHIHEFVYGEELREPAWHPLWEIKVGAGRIECVDRTGDIGYAARVRTYRGFTGERVYDPRIDQGAV